MGKQGTSRDRRIVPAGRIVNGIRWVRGRRVMLSQDLAEIYGVPVRQLNQAVKRNLDRFPKDFCFQLTKEEGATLRSQFVILETGRGQHAKYAPYAFTEEGVAMLSAVLRSPTAVAVSIQIIRVFVRLRQILASHDGLRRKLADLERKLLDHDKQFAVVFDAIRQLMAEPEPPPKPRIGFRA